MAATDFCGEMSHDRNVLGMACDRPDVAELLMQAAAEGDHHHPASVIREWLGQGLDAIASIEDATAREFLRTLLSGHCDMWTLGDICDLAERFAAERKAEANESSDTEERATLA